MITNAQIRGGPALLSWSQLDLASASGVSRQSIQNFEVGMTDPGLSTAAVLRDALVDGGVVFLDPGDVAPGVGVALRALNRRDKPSSA